MGANDELVGHRGRQSEALELLSELEAVCANPQPGEAERLSAYRLLHSLKSWAALRHLAETENLCHRLETVVRGEGPLLPVMVEQMTASFPALRRGLEQLRGSPPQKVPRLVGDNVRILTPGNFRLSEKEISLITELRAQGREIQVIRIWISPDETMPVTRILLLQSILEDHSLIHCEAWLWGANGPVGPQNTRSWAQSLMSENPPDDQAILGARGAVYRCIVSRNASITDLMDRLWTDQVEAIDFSVLSQSADLKIALQPGNIAVPELAPRDFYAQNLLVSQRRFMPGPRGMSVNSYLSYENSWRIQTNLLQGIQGIDAGEYIRRIFRQASELPLARAGENPAPQWRLLVEPLQLPEMVLRAIGDVLVQLIRNSLAHGRQDAATRLAQHKSAALIIKLTVLEEADFLILHYSDDGSGIDPDRVLGKAGRSPGEPMTDADLLEIISTPEFSTQEQAQINAGRGMGLNMVDHTIRQILRGSLELRNRQHGGCSFTIKIPRRLFPISVMIFQGLTENFAIPSVYFFTSVPLHATSIDHENDAQWYFRFAGSCLKFYKSETLSSADGLEGLTGVVLARDGVACGLIPVRGLIGSETVLAEVASEGVFVRALQSWINLYTGEPELSDLA